MKSWPHRSRGAMSIRCLIWIVESTAFSARYELPSSHSAPMHLPFSTIRPLIHLLVRITPPCASMNRTAERSEEHTSELQSRQYLVCRLLLEKKKNSERD